MKKLLLLVWCLYFSATCRQISGTDLVFVNASYQSWSGGAAGSGQGTNYYFNFLTKSSAISGDSAWVDGYVLPVTTKISGDSVHFIARAYFRRQMGQINGQNNNYEPPKEAAPITVKAAAVISYLIGKNKKFIAVPAMKRLQPISYP